MMKALEMLLYAAGVIAVWTFVVMPVVREVRHLLR